MTIWCWEQNHFFCYQNKKKFSLFFYGNFFYTCRFCKYLLPEQLNYYCFLFFWWILFFSESLLYGVDRNVHLFFFFLWKKLRTNPSLGFPQFTYILLTLGFRPVLYCCLVAQFLAFVLNWSANLQLFVNVDRWLFTVGSAQTPPFLHLSFREMKVTTQLFSMLMLIYGFE